MQMYVCMNVNAWTDICVHDVPCVSASVLSSCASMLANIQLPVADAKQKPQARCSHNKTCERQALALAGKSRDGHARVSRNKSVRWPSASKQDNGNIDQSALLLSLPLLGFFVFTSSHFPAMADDSLSSTFGGRQVSVPNFALIFFLKSFRLCLRSPGLCLGILL